MRIWDWTTGNFVSEIAPDVGPLCHAALSPDGSRVVAVREDGGWIMAETSTGKQIHAVSADKVSARFVAYQPDGKSFATVGEYLTLWDAASGNRLRESRLGGKELQAACFSPGGKQLATAAKDGNIRIFDVSEGRLIKRIPIAPNRSIIECISLTPTAATC